METVQRPMDIVPCSGRVLWSHVLGSLRHVSLHSKIWRIHALKMLCAVSPGLHKVIFSERFGGQTPYMVITQASNEFSLH